MTRTRKEQAIPARSGQIDSLADSMNSGSAKARMILILVTVFIVAYGVVLMMKVQRDRVELERQAQVSFARQAQIAAADMASRTAFVRGAVIGAARGVQTDWERDATGIDRHLDALAARPEIVGAALVASDGQPAVMSDGADGVMMAQALKRRGGRGVWVAVKRDGSATLYSAAEVAQADDVFTLVVEINPRLLTAPRDRFFLIDATGASLIADVAVPITNPQLFEEVLGDVGAATTVDLPQISEPVLVSASPVGGVGGAFVLLAEPLVLTAQDWRRTVVFYLLLLAAPVLVSVGLCAVLMMQIENVRSTRRKLIDSERRFRLAVEGARCGVWDWDLDSDVVYVTPSLARMLGQRQTRLMDKGEFLKLIHEDDREKLELVIKNASRIGHVDVEFRAATRTCFLHARGRPWLASSDQKSNRVVGVAIDVTEQRGQQWRLDEADRQLAQALNSINESFALWDSNRKLVLSNPRFGEFFKLDANLTRAGTSYDDFEMAAATAIKRVHPKHEQGLTEMELNDGRWLLVSDRPTVDGGMVTIGADISALKKHEGRLTENDKHLRQTIKELGRTKERLENARNEASLARTRAEEASRSKTEFLANMSHELRTPLNAINGFSEIMKDEMFGALGDDRYKEYARDIWNSGQHLLQLISDILDMSKIEAGKMSLSYETVWPDELAEQCSRLIRPRVNDANLTYENRVGQMPEIMADPRVLKQVLLNLLSNAVKFTRSGGRVTLTGRGDNTGVTFEVSDTGVGIAKAHMERLGRPFEQIESHRSKRHQGSGLGLALSKTLTDLHGGSLTLESELGVGTTVTVWIPRHPPENPEKKGLETGSLSDGPGRKQAGHGGEAVTGVNGVAEPAE